MQRPASLQDKALVSGKKVENMVISLEQAGSQGRAVRLYGESRLDNGAN
jgi:hypothetical protein